MRFPIRIALAAVILAATAGAAHASPHGTLVVRGSNAGDTLALRLQAGHPKTLEIDFNDDGIADRRINRKSVKRIRIKTFAGDDVLIGGAGLDALGGGSGDNIVMQ